MGFFDLPAPLFMVIDNLMSGLPVYPKLLIWSALTAILSMALYWFCSKQDEVAEAKQRALAARRSMASYQGTEFDEMLPLAKESLIASGRHFGIVLWPALLSSLPALAIIVWVSNQFAYSLPNPGAYMHAHTDPEIPLADLSAVLIQPELAFMVEYPETGKSYDIVVANGEYLLTLPLSAPVPVVHKRQWWNWLIGNPNGYLPAENEIEAIHFTLPAIKYLNVGPGWVQGWEFSYFSLLIIVSLAIKFAFRIH
jgi:hypothetical protein